MKGEIAAVGPGDRILFDKWSGSEIKFDGEDLLIMNEIGCVIENPGVANAKKKAV
ncbi:MAG: hypothetical protein OJF58_003918 [Enhydrobacter sp.]|jgi:co-chaperonin GroES (HSP10)|nr:MAG: hypothetical protein OJF58_003918 [Enhydrobacter sp.]